MPDYSTLGSQISVFKTAATSVMTSSSLSATDLGILGNGLNTIGNALGVIDIYNATTTQIASLNAAAAAAIASVNTSGNGSIIASNTSQITTLQNQMTNVNSFIATNSTQYSNVTSQLNAIQSSIATVPSSWKSISSSYQAVNNDRLLVSAASAGLVVTLPLNPSAGYQVQIVDANGTAGSINFTVARNLQPIQGVQADLTFNVNGASITLVYANSILGWRKV
jgi:hypothetical protein